VSLRVWWTGDLPDPDFLATWRARIDQAPHANFTFDPAYLSWRAAQGHAALAVLSDEGSRRGALVLREENGRLECGWPWRWQAVIEDGGRHGPVGLEPDEAQWLFRQARFAAGARRVAIHLPVPPAPGVPAYRSGSTILYRVDRDDAELLAAMLPSKRRQVRRAQQRGYRVVEADTAEQFRAFAWLQRETLARHGQYLPPPAADPPPGHGWREWEAPWMWLLLATREGRVESGLGDGLRPGGMVEARTAASTESARRDGAFALLSFEEARRVRDRGARWINLGGDSTFKREAAGRLGQSVAMFRWLGAARASDLSAHVESVWHRARAGLAAFARATGMRGSRALVGAALADLLASDLPALMECLARMEWIVCA
jgi:hypothetical protein